MSLISFYTSMLLHSHSLYSSHSNGAENGKCNPLVVKDAKDKEKSKKTNKKKPNQATPVQ